MLALLFVVLLVLIFLGAPVLLAIGATAVGGSMAVDGVEPVVLPQRMFSMVDSFSLLALPYFILAGELMARGGLSKKLVEFSEAAVGHLRGGLAHASVLSSMAFANVSGSATASTSAIGSVLIPAMKQRGYKPGFAAALMACSGIIGSIIPPSMVMIVYGSLMGVSVGDLFLAGVLPGLLIVGTLMGTIHAHSFLRGFPELRQVTSGFSLKALLATIPRVWAALLAPVIILGGILAGIFTATEAGVVACVYALVVACVVERSVRWRDLPAILVRAALTTAVVVGVIAAAGAFSQVMVHLQFSQTVLGWIEAISTRPRVVLALLLLVMLVLTMFIESLAVLILVTPVIQHVAAVHGYDPLHLGMLMVMATQIGATTPPVAVGLFVATSIAETSYNNTLRACWPFVLALMAVLAILFFAPWLATWLPAAAG